MLPPFWALLGTAAFAAGGDKACGSQDVICQNLAKVFMFGSSFQYDGVPHIELAFVVFMLLWIGTTTSLAAQLVAE